MKLINIDEDVTVASIAKVREDKSLIEEIEQADGEQPEEGSVE